MCSKKNHRGTCSGGEKKKEEKRILKFIFNKKKKIHVSHLRKKKKWNAEKSHFTQSDQTSDFFFLIPA